jgi:hypothetical protein
MSLDTRNSLHGAWYACRLFQQGDLEREQLVEMFYDARRALRADLELRDAEPPITLAAIKDRLAVPDSHPDTSPPSRFVPE